MSEPLGEVRVALDLWRAQREGPAGLARRQEQRLAALVAHARTSSPFYRHHYRNLPSERVLLRDLPAVTKPQLMAAFDDWVTEPAITRTDVEAFVSDPARAGHFYRDRYFVCTSSGTTGRPGLFVHDTTAVTIYRAVAEARVDVAWLTRRELIALMRRGLRFAMVIGTGGHFAGVGWMERERWRFPWRGRNYRTYSVLQPLAELVSALNVFDPTVIESYPSVLSVLADEQAAGRLRLRPWLISTVGESRTPGSRERLAAAFGCKIVESYACSECLVTAYGCSHDWLHVSSDWVILEPVDENLQPTPAGQPSHTVLLTNLANRVQPFIRYDLGDSVIARTEPCGCGSVLPAIRVSGRHDDVLHLDAGGGRAISVTPLAIGTVADETPGVHRSQLIQEAPSTIRLRLDLDPGVDVEAVWRRAIEALARYLTQQGAPGIEIIRASEPPQQVPGSGKFRQVIARVPRPTV